jgi:hypothetical protein
VSTELNTPSLASPVPIAGLVILVGLFGACLKLRAEGLRCAPEGQGERCPSPYKCQDDECVRSPDAGTEGSAGATGGAGSGGGAVAGAGMAGVAGAVAGAGGAVAGAGGASGARGGAPGLARGSHCTSAGDCANGICVEGVCCDTACNIKCKSCLKANTDQPDGTCAFVRGGASHGSDCSATNVSTCGLDGTCDGAGACRKHKAGSVCEPQSCPAESSTLAPASTCDGKGTCMNDVPISCGNYSCDSASNTCRSTCTSDSHCSASAFCSGNGCIPKLPDGAVCASNNQCRSRTCGGRCCPAGTTCTCPQPTPGNLIKNPGFDTDLSGWAVTPNDGAVTWDPVDALDCPYSGRARLAWSDGDRDTSPTISSCMPVQGGAHYNVGVRAFGPAWCDVNAYTKANCTESPTQLAQFQWINADWRVSQQDVQMPISSVSAEITCYMGTNGALSSFVDMAFLSPTPGLF